MLVRCWRLNFLGKITTTGPKRCGFCSAATKKPEENVQNSNYDIVIAGGGMVGTTMACSLAHNSMLKDKNILLLEAGPAKEYQISPKYSNRVSALSEATRGLMLEIGAWSLIESARFCPVKKMQVWEASSEAVLNFNNPQLDDPIAYIVENDVLMGAVTQRVTDSSATVKYGAKIESCNLDELSGRPTVTLSSGEKITCSLLIGADGAGSQVRKAIGGKYLSWNYDFMGVVATLKLSEPTSNVVAWQRFLPTGPIALLPLNGEMSSLVWSLPNEKAKHVLSLPSESFVDAVNEAFWKQHKQDPLVVDATRTVGRALASLLPFSSSSPGSQQMQPSIASEEVGSRAAFPLGFGHATYYVKHGAALIGDAAHRIHPLAGQGVNLGFGDVKCLTEILATSAQNGTALGQLKPLLDYEKERQRHNLPLMFGVDGMHRLYTTNNVVAALARGVGVTVVEALTPLKGLFSKYAAS
ncbi:ubiquinone biosynthesis monooxygenase COQ6, mitochondrial isoform X2 [Neocloeon triangulifer]|nr:ubiquinone biosynthesis monooxygenase COQ6, mitochondrial isoform X2 [Neocloeon triangulifer]